MTKGVTAVNGRPISPKSGPVKLDSEAEKRLVGLGVAEYVNERTGSKRRRKEEAPVLEAAEIE